MSVIGSTPGLCVWLFGKLSRADETLSNCQLRCFIRIDEASYHRSRFVTYSAGKECNKAWVVKGTVGTMPQQSHSSRLFKTESEIEFNLPRDQHHTGVVAYRYVEFYYNRSDHSPHWGTRVRWTLKESYNLVIRNASIKSGQVHNTWFTHSRRSNNGTDKHRFLHR